MEYQKNNELVRQFSNQPTEFRNINWIKINDDARGTAELNLKLQC